MNKKEPNIMYAFWANAFGPSFKRAQKVVKVGNVWWHKDGDLCVIKPGYTDDPAYMDEGWICYAHKDIQKVKAFADGFNAARKIIGQFCKD